MAQTGSTDIRLSLKTPADCSGGLQETWEYDYEDESPEAYHARMLRNEVLEAISKHLDEPEPLATYLPHKKLFRDILPNLWEAPEEDFWERGSHDDNDEDDSRIEEDQEEEDESMDCSEDQHYERSLHSYSEQNKGDLENHYSIHRSVERPEMNLDDDDSQQYGEHPADHSPAQAQSRGSSFSRLGSEGLPFHLYYYDAYRPSGSNLDQIPETVNPNDTLLEPKHQSAISQDDRQKARNTAWASLTRDDLDTFMSEGLRFKDNVSTFRIRDTPDEHRIGHVELDFVRLVSYHKEGKIAYQNFNHNGDDDPVAPEMKTEDFGKRFVHRRDKETRKDFSEFYNWLDISGSLLEAHVAEPDWFMHFGWRLLPQLRAKLHNSKEHNVGKSLSSSRRKAVRDLEPCFRFTLYGERYSFSGWHMDLLNGTWVQVLTGAKVWLIYTGPWTDKEKHQFRRDNRAWDPKAEQIQMIYLQPGDTLVMRPGHPVVHAVLTLDDSLCAGGMMWPEAGPEISNLIRNLEDMIPHPNMTNEMIPRQMPEYLTALRNHIRAAGAGYVIDLGEQVTEMVARLQKSGLLSCSGSQCGCRITWTTRNRPKKFKNPMKCPCGDPNEIHPPGCTSWCHPEIRAHDCIHDHP